MIRYIFKHSGWLVLTVFIRCIGAAMQVFVALILQNIIDAAMTGDIDRFGKVAVFSVGYILTLGMIDYFNGKTQAVYVKKCINSVRKDLFKGIIKKDYRNFKDANSGEYISMLTNDINSFEKNYVIASLMLVGDIVIFVTTITVLLSINKLITIVLILCGLMMLIIPSILGMPMAKKQKQVSNSNAEFTKSIKDIFSGYEVVKTFKLENIVGREFAKYNGKAIDSKKEMDIMESRNNAVATSLGFLCMATALIVGGYFVLVGSSSVGTLIAIVQLTNGIPGPIMWIMQKVAMIKGMKDINAKLLDVVNNGKYEEVRLEKFEFNEAIEINDLEFSYDENKKVLDGINCKFEKNKKYAILGESGCGKTTLIKLILGYYTDYSGCINIDGKDIEGETGHGSNLMSVIHQDVYMFDKSVKDNIVLGKEYSDDEIQDALFRSGVSDFIDDIGGVDGMVGENGSQISGGQKQRIAIARALIQKTPILILDEGTSSLDNDNAVDIEDRLLNQKDLTVITITHRINEELLNRYDEVILMSQGRISRKGKYSEIFV